VLAAGSEKQSGVTIVNFRYTNLLQTSNSLHITIVKISTMNSSKPFFYKLWLGVSLINGTILVAWFAGYDVLAPLRRKLRRQARQCNWRPVAPKTTTSKPTLGGRNAGIFSSPDHIGWINDDLPVQRRDQQAPEEGKKGKTGPRAPESVWKFFEDSGVLGPTCLDCFDMQYPRQTIVVPWEKTWVRPGSKERWMAREDEEEDESASSDSGKSSEG